MDDRRSEVPLSSKFAGGGREFSLCINGSTQKFVGEGDTPLLWVLRDALGLTGTKYGCGIAQCGACTVIRRTAGRALAIRSCVTPVRGVTADLTAITTIEGLKQGDELHPVQKAWLDANVPQCGYCQSGQIMATVALLEHTDDKPTPEEINQALAGHLCRCGTYPRIRRAIEQLARRQSRGKPAVPKCS